MSLYKGWPCWVRCLQVDLLLVSFPSIWIHLTKNILLLFSFPFYVCYWHRDSGPASGGVCLKITCSPWTPRRSCYLTPIPWFPHYWGKLLNENVHFTWPSQYCDLIWFLVRVNKMNGMLEARFESCLEGNCVMCGGGRRLMMVERCYIRKESM